MNVFTSTHELAFLPDALSQTSAFQTNAKILVPVILILPQMVPNVVVNIMALKDDTVMKKLVSIEEFSTFIAFFVQPSIFFLFTPWLWLADDNIFIIFFYSEIIIDNSKNIFWDFVIPFSLIISFQYEMVDSFANFLIWLLNQYLNLNQVEITQFNSLQLFYFANFFLLL